MSNNYYLNQVKHLQKHIEQIHLFLQKVPDGYLRCKSKKAGFEYYHVVNKNHRYLKLTDQELKETLAMKQYYIKLLPFLENELYILNSFLSSYHPEEKFNVYESLSESRKSLIEPFSDCALLSYNQWKSEHYLPSKSHMENLKHHTVRGEIVRSKSEVIIANLLNDFSSYLDYRYEKPIYLPNGDITVRPDFTIFFLKSGNIKYWEHAGIMDSPEYSNHFVSKINLYSQNGIHVGKNLILSFETSDVPLSLPAIKSLIEFEIENNDFI